MIDAEDKDTLEKNTYRYNDYKHVQSGILSKVKDALEQSFPKEWGGIRLEIKNIKAEPVSYDFSQQKNALLQNEFLSSPLKGDLFLYDSKTGALLDSMKNKALMRIPYYTERGTFIHNGNEYSTLKQMRLRPGIYSRRKANGQLETQFNIQRGTGTGYRIILDPDTGIYKFNQGQSNVSLYSILHDMGVSDKELEDTWGKDTLDRNRKTYDARALPKVYSNMVRKGTATSAKDQAQELRDVFDKQLVDADIRKSNLGF